MDRVKLLPCQGEHYGYSPTQGDALGCVLMAFQAVSALGYHYFRNLNHLLFFGRLERAFSYIEEEVNCAAPAVAVVLAKAWNVIRLAFIGML